MTEKAVRIECTILFCDIRGFTALFDQRDPLEAMVFANAVLGTLGAVVEHCHGSIDKFTGDGFLAHFGVTEQVDNHAKNACECALRMRVALEKLNSTRYLALQPIVNIGIGINSGVVAAGTISTHGRQEFTVLGSVVNLAARIEGLTKYFGVDCLISTATQSGLNEAFLLQKMPERRLRGVEDSETTFWLLPMNQVSAESR